jgi:uncharacterized protein YvpB
MYKDIVKKILTTGQINDAELNEFLVNYIKDTKNKDLTGEQLAGIKQLISMGAFDLNYAIKQAAMNLKLQLVSVVNINTKQVLRTDVYEE